MPVNVKELHKKVSKIITDDHDKVFAIVGLLVDAYYEGEQNGIDKAFNAIEKPEEAEYFISNCCGSKLVENTDLCSNCKEHCTPVKEGDWGA